MAGWLAGPDKWAWTTLLRGDKDKEEEEGELWGLAENRPQICLGIVVVVVVVKLVKCHCISCQGFRNMKRVQ